ncbi:hypothetical protein V8C86DRAFT_1642104 [Haematococcus lacustris]
MAWHGVAWSGMAWSGIEWHAAPAAPCTQAFGPECALTRVVVGPPSWHMIRHQALQPTQSTQTITHPCSACLHEHSCCLLTHAPAMYPTSQTSLTAMTALTYPYLAMWPAVSSRAARQGTPTEARGLHLPNQPRHAGSVSVVFFFFSPPAQRATRPHPQDQHLPNQPSGQPVPTSNCVLGLSSPSGPSDSTCHPPPLLSL